MIERWRLSSMHVLPSPTINLFGDKQQTVTTTPPLDALAFILAFDPSQTKLESIFRREETASPFCWPSKLVECKVCRNANILNTHLLLSVRRLKYKLQDR